MTKVTARFAFNLPFHIVMKGKYQNKPQFIKIDSEEIVVYAPALSPFSDKKPLGKPEYEYVIGEEENGKRVWKAEWINIDITREFLTIPITDEQQEALVNKAREILYKLLTLYRWRGELQIDPSYLDFKYDLFYADTEGNHLKAGPGDTKGLIFGTLIVHTGRIPEWNDICQDLISGNTPELYESLLVDAHSVVAQEPRRAVLDAATACEVFIEKYCESAKQNNPKFDSVVYSALTQRAGLLSYFHEVLRYLFRRSLKEEKATIYKELDCLVRTNNFVKHEGLCQYRDDKGKVIQVDSARARAFINAVEEATQYAKSL